MKKILTLILAICMISTLFAACAKDASDGNESTQESTGTPDNQMPEDTKTNDLENMGLPEGIDFGKEPVNVVYWDSWYPEFEVDEDTLDGDPVADAVFKKNLYTEEALNVDLQFIFQKYLGNSKEEMQQWCENLKNMMSDTSTPIDIFSCYSRVLATATVNGLNQDITQYDNIDLSKEWWPKKIQNEFSLKDKLFIITGDISPNVLYNMYCIFYNKTLANQLGKGDLVQMVRDQEWTIDKLMELTMDTFQDTDNEPGLSSGDTVGYTGSWWSMDAIIQGAGFKILKTSSEDGVYMTLTEDFLSEKFDSFINTMGKWAAGDDVFIDPGYDGTPGTIFSEGRALFMTDIAGYGSKLQGLDIDYGILPPPLLNPDQQKGEYVTTLGNGYSNYSIARTCTEGERAAAVLQSLGYFAYKYTTPAIFDVTFKGKFSKAEEVSEMFDVVRRAIGFDLGLLYQRELDSINDKPTWCISEGQQWLGSAMNPLMQKALNKLLSKLNTTLDDIVKA